jgi:hypothetical protein
MKRSRIKFSGVDSGEIYLAPTVNAVWKNLPCPLFLKEGNLLQSKLEGSPFEKGGQGDLKGYGTINNQETLSKKTPQRYKCAVAESK